MIDRSGLGLITIVMDADHRYDDELNRYYDEEHMPERVALPGYLSGRRFGCVEGSPKYLAIYEVENLDVLTTDIYRELKEGSPWSRIVRPYQINNKRNVYLEMAPPVHAIKRPRG